jgi:thiol-disulfide isomerase/thioredoxin
MTLTRRQVLGALPALPMVATAIAAKLAAGANEFTTAPEFTSQDERDWINSPPLRWMALAGRVVLLDIWTSECWNCYRSFPWLRSVETRFAPRGLAIVGIHSPELEVERDRARVAQKAREFKLDHPIMIDNDFRYWKALNNEYWPAFYLVDRHQRMRATFFGETHQGDLQATRIESTIEKLLAERT